MSALREQRVGRATAGATAPLQARLWRACVAGALLVGLVVAGCSPEAARARGSLGADVGNTALPVELRGDPSRNNPSFRTPEIGQVPRDAKGVPGWWVASRP